MFRNNRPRLVDTASLFTHPIKKILYGIFLQPGVERALGVDKFNAVYALFQKEKAAGKPLAEAVEAVFTYLRIRIQIAPDDLTRLQKIEGPLVIVSNHPFGGLEALFFVLLMSKVRQDFKIMANFLVGRIPEIKDHLIMVDPFGEADSQRKNLAALKDTLQYLKGGGFLGVFPAGEVAAFDVKTGKVHEPEWTPHIARLAQKAGATVVPIYFYGTNSILFHLAGMLDPRLRTSMLIREFVYPNTVRLRYKIGSAIPPQKIRSFADPQSLTQYLKSKTYILGAVRPPSTLTTNLKRPIRLVRNTVYRPAPIIAAVDRALLVAEINTLTALCVQAPFAVYLTQAERSPNIMREIGRLREQTFRAVGEGSGKGVDIDSFDSDYLQLFIWHTENKEIVGAYRIGQCDKLLKPRGQKGLYLNTLFDIQPEFYQKISPALELGRSFVRLEYQKSYAPLLLLWVGIGHYLVQNPGYRYLIGPVSISASFHYVSRNLMVRFLTEQYSDKELSNFIKPKNPFKFIKKYDFYSVFDIKDIGELQAIIEDVEGEDTRIPILLKHYLKLNAKILAFNIDPDFQNALDAFIVTDVPAIDSHTLKRYMTPEGMQKYLSVQRYPDSMAEFIDGDI